MSNLISIGAIIDQGYHRYKAHFRELFSISLWVLAGYPFFLGASILFNAGPATTTTLYVSLILQLIGFVVSVVASITTFNALVLAARNVDSDKRLQTADLLRAGRKKFWSALGLWILVALITVSSLLLMAPGAVMLGVESLSSISVLVPLLGILFLFVGGIAAACLCAFLGITYIFAPYSLLLEDRKVAATISRAHALVRERWWDVAIRVVVPKLTVLVIVLFANYILLNLISIIGAMLMSPNVSNTALTLAVIVMVKQIVVTAVTAFATPFFVLADYYVFTSLVGTGPKGTT